MIRNDEVIGAYIGIRNKIAELDKVTKAQKKVLLIKQDALIEHFLKVFEATGDTSVKTAQGTAFRAVKDSVTISDRLQFYTFIIHKILMAVNPKLYTDESGKRSLEGQVIYDRHVEAVMSCGIFDLMSVSANKNGCKGFSDESDIFPDGVSYRSEKIINFRSPTK